MPARTSQFLRQSRGPSGSGFDLCRRGRYVPEFTQRQPRVMNGARLEIAGSINQLGYFPRTDVFQVLPFLIHVADRLNDELRLLQLDKVPTVFGEPKLAMR